MHETSNSAQADLLATDGLNYAAEFLQRLNAARRQAALYGKEHESTVNLARELLSTIESLLNAFGRATFVFTKEGVILNEGTFSCRDAREFYHLLRSRGAVAMTLVAVPSAEEVCSFLGFLASEPKAIRGAGGARKFLRELDVRNIVMTDALYTGIEADADSNDMLSAKDIGIDAAIAQAIGWLNRKSEDEGDDIPTLPIIEILSDPYMAAKLIREAVMRMHSSRPAATSNELAVKALDELQHLANDPVAWDKALPQIRHAMSKMPRELRPVAAGLASSRKPAAGAPGLLPDVRSAVDVEAILAKDFAGHSTGDGDFNGVSSEELARLEQFFDMQVEGMPTGWSKELNQDSLLRSAADTLSSLLKWSNGGAEHYKIASSLCVLAVRALENGRDELGLYVMQKLLGDADHQDAWPWRRINIKSALRRIDPELVKKFVEESMRSWDHDRAVVAASLVMLLPDVALSMLKKIDTCNDHDLTKAVMRGSIESESGGASALAGKMRTGTPFAREYALELLLSMRTASAINEIAEILNDTDSEFAAIIVGSMHKAGEFGVGICVDALSHKSQHVRLAAISSLGKARDVSALPYMRKLATMSFFRSGRLPEKLAAIRAVGDIGGDAETEFLNALSARTSLLFRGSSRAVRETALESAAKARGRKADEGLHQTNRGI
ncbi:MAG TPA: hypothetical protein VGK34_00965 [Armatimonadota bacterium]